VRAHRPSGTWRAGLRYGCGVAGVLFLPGIIAPAALRYAALFECLGAREVVAKDLAVYDADAPPADYSIAREVESIDAAAARAGFDRFHLYGHSGGGACALAYAAARPQRVLSLAVDEPASDFTPQDIDDPYWNEIRAAANMPEPDAGIAFLRLQLAPGVDLPPAPQGAPPPWMAKRPAGIAAFVRALPEHRVDPASYRAFAAPVLFTHGTRSHPRWESMRARLEGLFPDFAAERFDGLHHLNTSHQAEPARTAALLENLWSRAETKS
jgi:pimeloyl-ACP methyl ester carboxylesterase